MTGAASKTRRSLETVGGRLEHARGSLSRARLAELLRDEMPDSAGSVVPRTIARYEVGERSPSTEYLQAVGRVLKVDVGWLLTGSGPAPSSVDDVPPAPRDSTDLPETVDPGDVVWIDRFSARPTAGRGGVLDDHRDGRYPLLAELAKQWGHPRVKLGAVRVRGDSMAPTLHDGDFVIVAADPTVRHEVCVVAVRGELWVKRIGIDPASGGLVLISDNTNYPPQIVGPDSDVRIVGPVVKEDRVRRR